MFFIVTLSIPILPAIFFPFKTLPGVVPCPMAPGALCLSDCPWVFGPPAKCQRLTTPANPFPFEVPVTLTTSPTLKMSEAFTWSPTLKSLSFSNLTSRKNLGAHFVFPMAPFKCPCSGLERFLIFLSENPS